jgi:hypothetical protein
LNALARFGYGAATSASLLTAMAGTALAADCTNVTGGTPQAGADCARPTGVPAQLFGEGSIFQTIANVLIFLVGTAAVIFLIIGGLRYVLSQGNASAVEGAKNTILYAIIGIIVAVMAFAIVNFVLTNVLTAQ